MINFEYLFGNGATVLTFITPILTMRMFAEERRNGTEQLILTSPRSITSIVLGKFIAAGIIMIITEGLTLMYYGQKYNEQELNVYANGGLTPGETWMGIGIPDDVSFVSKDEYYEYN